jgi:site-specific DNA-methyltransferase (adenine-specific)
MLDAQAREGGSSFRTSRDHQGGLLGWQAGNQPGFDDRGGPSRFFYTAKASRGEREAGVDVEPARRADSDSRDDDAPGSNSPRLRVNARRNDHPTVKPVDLMAWLCRLVTPPGGVILDPFLGSGTTIMAALDEGFRAIGIDRDEHYIEIAQQRIEYRHLLTADVTEHATGESEAKPRAKRPPMERLL